MHGSQGKKKRTYSRIRADSGQQRRMKVVMALLGAAAFVPVIVQLFSLMVTQYDRYAALALSNQSRSTSITPERGDIYDRNMNVLAASRSVENVYIDPRELHQTGADLQDMTKALSDILDVPEEKILKLANDRSMRYHLIRDRIDTEQASQVRDYINRTGICGVHLEPNTQRYYPYHSLAGQVIGFTNASNQGAEGIEASYDRYLSGQASRVSTTKGNNEMDMPYSVERYLEGQKGNSIVTTLDMTVQACLESRMQQAIDQYDVQNGAFGMVMDVNTGQILAMATLGGYDPNHYLELGDLDLAQQIEMQRMEYLPHPQGSPEYEQGREIYRKSLVDARLKQWRNRCLSDGYEPGSTFKTITLAAAIDCGAVDLNTTFSCSGAEQIPGRSQLLHCWRARGHGTQTTAQALQNSCNLAFAHIGLKLGGERFYQYVKDFGILEKTGIDLAGESAGVFFSKELITDTDKWGTASLTSGSFGQTFKVTPLQLVRAVSAVVNGGRLMEPYVVSEVLDEQGNILVQRQPKMLRRVISQQTSDTMRAMIESVVTEGTAKNATVLGYRVGGKTGTSEKIDIFDENGQRVQDKIVSFVGIAPMDDPRYIILVALDTPSRETGIYISGGVMAAPTVGAILADILPYLQVSKVYDPEDPSAQQIRVPDLSGLTVKEVQQKIKDLPLEVIFSGDGEVVIDQLPKPAESLQGGSQMIAYLQEAPDDGMTTVPDLRGMTVAEAADAAGAGGVCLLPDGNSDLTRPLRVQTQDPLPGTRLARGSIVRIRFADLDARD